MKSYEEIDFDTADPVLTRFLHYVRIHTTSDEALAGEQTPSTACQWDLIHHLEGELHAIGIEDVSVDEYGYLIARLPGNLPPEHPPVDTIGFMAHVDTNADAPGDNVLPIVHDYDGSVIKLNDGSGTGSGGIPPLKALHGLQGNYQRWNDPFGSR